MTDEKLEKIARKVATEGQSAHMAVMFPFLFPFYLYRLIQWYVLRQKVETSQVIDQDLRSSFLSVMPKLWLAAAAGPILIAGILIYVTCT